jgi:hypothetical protein
MNEEELRDDWVCHILQGVKSVWGYHRTCDQVTQVGRYSVISVRHICNLRCLLMWHLTNDPDRANN